MVVDEAMSELSLFILNHNNTTNLTLCHLKKKAKVKYKENV